LNTTMLRLGGVDITNIKGIKTFDEAYTIMLALAAKYSNDKPDDRKATVIKILDVLNRAVDLADPNVSEAKLAEVKANLAWAYLESGDPFKAVVLGEHLAHSMTSVPKAAAGGAYALRAYATMISDPGADARWAQSDTERMHRLALFMEKTYPTNENTNAV